MFMAIYDKPHLTHAEQVRHLKAKGMTFGDESLAMVHLARIGYYRLSAYWHPYKARHADTDNPSSERFREGTRFEDVLKLYDYDSQIRRLVLEGVEITEVSLRSQVAHLLGARDAFAYIRPEQLHGNFSKVDREGKTPHQRWLEGYQEKMLRPGEVFTAHLITKYGLPLPIWASVELWELNQLCFLLSGLKQEDKIALSRTYGLSNPELLVSWVRAIKGIRNHAAHHGRIWNRNLTKQPRLPVHGEIPALNFILEDAGAIRQARCACPLLLMAHMISMVDPHSPWLNLLNSTVADFPTSTGMSPTQMGFPDPWAGFGKRNQT